MLSAAVSPEVSSDHHRRRQTHFSGKEESTVRLFDLLLSLLIAGLSSLLIALLGILGVLLGISLLVFRSFSVGTRREEFKVKSQYIIRVRFEYSATFTSNCFSSFFPNFSSYSTYFGILIWFVF